MTRPQRQVFTQGQFVKVKAGGYYQWSQAVVVVADIEHKEGRWFMDKGRRIITVHDVQVWPVEGGWYAKRYKGPMAAFRTDTITNSRKCILSLEEYDATVGAVKAAKAAAHDARVKQDGIDWKKGLTFITAEMMEAAAKSDAALRYMVETYVEGSQLRRTGRHLGDSDV